MSEQHDFQFDPVIGEPIFLLRPLNDQAKQHLLHSLGEGKHWRDGAAIMDTDGYLPLWMSLTREGWRVRG